MSRPATIPHPRQWLRWRFLLAGAVLLAACLVPAELLYAQGGVIDKRLALSVQPKFGVYRGHAPISLSVSLKWSSPELIEGHLELGWYVDRSKLGSYVSPDLALADSSIKQSLMLPPVMLSHDDAIFSVQGRFITEDQIYDLDVHDVALQPDWRRILVVGNCTPAVPVPRGGNELLIAQQRSLAFDHFDLEPFFENRFTRRELKVETADVDPDDVPTDPLEMTNFDVFVIEARSLSKLRQRQLDSLLGWVHAGGSLCVFVDSAVSEDHLNWLNRLAGRDVTDAAYLRDGQGQGQGHVIASEESSQGVHKHVLDLGRAVVVLNEPDFASDEWEQALLHLWKVRADRRSAALKDRLWTQETAPFRDSFGLYVQMEPQRIWQAPELTKFLLPDSVQGLPLGTVSLVLVLFLLAIAPGDYVLLGWLKRRRWTWVLFPAVSLLFTGSMMWLARQHLGQSSFERSITVIDVGENGQPVRTSQFQMIYTASNRTVIKEVQHAIMVPLDPNADRLVWDMNATARTPRQYEQPWLLTGRVPAAYEVHRQVQQWAPRVDRATNFGTSDADEPVIPASISRLLNEHLQPAVDSPAAVSIDPSLTLLRLARTETESLSASQSVPAAIVQLAESITRRPESGFFSVVSQLSPTNGGNWEDLSLLDPSDPRQTVVVAVQSPDEGQYIIYRKLSWKQD